MGPKTSGSKLFVSQLFCPIYLFTGPASAYHVEGGGKELSGCLKLICSTSVRALGASRTVLLLWCLDLLPHMNWYLTEQSYRQIEVLFAFLSF